ncbi:hypothetical protein [Roseibium sediminis]|uniref:hypothetical protein n=1 Tax=Roseibium sediminis TaxID=1775174 RepID=UPI00123D7516|nr:hypothetical protein [Roseibium sediminis]
MIRLPLLTISACTLSGVALAHPALRDHPHPHTDAASYFTIETLLIFLLGLCIGGLVALLRRRKETEE